MFVSPLLLLVSILIFLESGGPVFFRQQRGGLYGRPFIIYKFRTMSVMEDGASITHAVRNDPRVTRLGSLLRRSSVDELPQLFNVLRGEMSLVGPRPHAIAHDFYYGSVLPDYRRRTLVKPGLTGAAQVSGHRGEIASLEDMSKRVAHDLTYVDNWTPWLDYKLMILTIAKIPAGV